MSGTLAFVLVAEAGDLEIKATLLVESIRRFSGSFKDSDIWVVQPRNGKRLSKETVAKLDLHRAILVRVNLNRTWKHYGVANKIYAAAFVESILSGKVDTIVLLDSDTIILQPPKELLLQGQEVLAIRPVDTVNIGLRFDEEINEYWQVFYDTFQVDPSKVWPIETTCDQIKLKAYFNSGLVAVKPECGIFKLWKDTFERLVAHPVIEKISEDSKDFFHLDQASLAALILGKYSRSQIRILNHQYNFPLHMYAEEKLSDEFSIGSIEDLVVVHYHHLFYSLDWIKSQQISADTKDWFLDKLPLLNLKNKWAKVPGYKFLKKLA